MILPIEFWSANYYDHPALTDEALAYAEKPVAGSVSSAQLRCYVDADVGQTMRLFAQRAAPNSPIGAELRGTRPGGNVTR
jgi:hypothetical protein